MSEQIEDHVKDRFEILKLMGKGAYGIVWKVKDKKTDRVMALKKIYDAFYNEIDSQRTYREVMYLKELKDNVNIVKLEEVIRANNDKDLYLVFEYMDADLHHVIKSNILSEIHKKYIIYQLFKALKYIHSAGLVHRDLKPSNLLINSDCLIKIADFGLARSMKHDEGSDPVVSEYVATRWYRAPEILLGSKCYSQSVDIWSAGCILAELFLGKVLFSGKGTVNQLELLIQLLDKPNSEDILALSSEHAEKVISSLNVSKTRSFTLLFSMMGKQGIDLIRRMLCFNPMKRITVDEVLAHPYLKDFSAKECSFPTRSPIQLPINDNLKMSVTFYRDALYKLMAGETKENNLTIPRAGIETLIPSAHHKSSTSKERYSTKDISEDKNNNLLQPLARAKSSTSIAVDQQDSPAFNFSSQFSALSSKKNPLGNKRSTDKATASKKEKLLKKKQSIDGLVKSPTTESKRMKPLLKDKKTKQSISGPVYNTKSSLHSSTVLLRRHSNAYIEERQSCAKKEKKKTHMRSISPQLISDSSKVQLSSKIWKAQELIRKRSASPVSKEAIKELLSLENTEKFFRKFEPLKKQSSISKVVSGKSTCKTKGDLTAGMLRKVSKPSILNTSTAKLTSKGGQLKGLLKGVF